MSVPEVVIEPLQQRGHQHWQVRMGRRTLTFNEEHAARAFAAQLHMRLAWLHQSHTMDAGLAPPEISH